MIARDSTPVPYTKLSGTTTQLLTTTAL